MLVWVICVVRSGTSVAETLSGMRVVVGKKVGVGLACSAMLEAITFPAVATAPWSACRPSSVEENAVGPTRRSSPPARILKSTSIEASPVNTIPVFRERVSPASFCMALQMLVRSCNWRIAPAGWACLSLLMIVLIIWLSAPFPIFSSTIFEISALSINRLLWSASVWINAWEQTRIVSLA